MVLSHRFGASQGDHRIECVTARTRSDRL